MNEEKKGCKGSGTAVCKYLNFEIMKKCSDYLMKVIEVVGPVGVYKLGSMSDEADHIYHFIWNFKFGRKRTKGSWLRIVAIASALFEEQLKAYYGKDKYLQLIHEEHELFKLINYGKLSDCLDKNKLENQGYLKWTARRKEEFHKLCPTTTRCKREL